MRLFLPNVSEDDAVDTGAQYKTVAAMLLTIRRVMMITMLYRHHINTANDIIREVKK